MLREDGWNLTTLVEHYGRAAEESAADVDWLKLCGDRGWPVLMKDAKIRYRTAERDALKKAGVTAFCLSSGNLRSAEMAEVIIQHKDVVWEKASAGGAAICLLSSRQARLAEL